MCCNKSHLCYNIKYEKKRSANKLIYDECSTLPKSRGNGQLVRRVSVDDDNKVTRYNLAYINHNLCGIDNGRVLGYDNAHGYHHKHFMGRVEPVEFISFEEIENRFQREFGVLYEKTKKQ